jgi:hypothetical protein
VRDGGAALTRAEDGWASSRGVGFIFSLEASVRMRGFVRVSVSVEVIEFDTHFYYIYM